MMLSHFAFVYSVTVHLGHHDCTIVTKVTCAPYKPRHSCPQTARLSQPPTWAKREVTVL